MRVLLDGRCIAESAPTLREGIAAASAAARGRLIVAGELDGRELSGDELASPGAGRVVGALLRVTSADPAELAAQTLAEARDGLRAVRGQQLDCSRAVVRGEVEACLSGMAAVMDHWRVAREALSAGASALAVPLDEIRTPDGSTATEAVGSLAAVLTELKRCIAAEDWSALGDALGHDLGAEADRWIGVLSVLYDRAHGRVGSARRDRS